MRTTVITNNNDKEARAPSLRFCQPIEMYNLGEIKGFCPESCYLRLSSNLVLNEMQQPEPDLPYGTVPEPRAQMARLFLVFIYIWQEDVAKIP